MSELKSCPFCKGEARPMAQHWDDGSHVWWVECRVCGAEGKRCDDILGAIDAWNMRAIAATLGGGMLTAEQVREAIFNNSSYASYDGARYYADGIGMQAVADELNARAERTCHIEMYPMGLYEEDGEAPICSACRVAIDEDVYYCPNCGARVEVEE